MNMKVLVQCGLAACKGFFGSSALCMGAGTGREIALKIGAVFAAGAAANKTFSKVNWLSSYASIPLAYRQSSLTLGSSDLVASWAMVVKAVSVAVVQPIANRLIDGIYSKGQRNGTKK